MSQTTPENNPVLEAAKALCCRRTAVADAAPEATAAAQTFCEGYKRFLDGAKTEREAVKTCLTMLEAAGYRPFVPGQRLAPGDKVYKINRQKCVMAATIGRRPLRDGFRLNVAHIDSPRLDLRPMPLYEAANQGGPAPQLTYLGTHYYGGLRKYQWPTIPLAMHGVIYRADGSCAEIDIGEKPEDPVFTITDLLPHLGAKQNQQPLREAITAENLNVLIGSLPLAEADPDVRGRVKLNILRLLHEAYGITERDFARAEIEVVPAFGARDVGLDRSMVGAYGQDDCVDAYAALMAELEIRDPARTTVCVLTDKEETGSNGVTGLNSMYPFHFLQQLCAAQGEDVIAAYEASKCISSDVAAAFDPNFADAFQVQNAAYAGDGVAICKYTGSRGKSNASDASAELVSWLTGILDANGVVWQTAEMGRIDLGGGGTVSRFVTHQGIDTIDVGVPVLAMHAPFEVVAKNDVYMAYLAFKAFLEADV